MLRLVVVVVLTQLKGLEYRITAHTDVVNMCVCKYISNIVADIVAQDDFI